MWGSNVWGFGEKGVQVMIRGQARRIGFEVEVDSNESRGLRRPPTSSIPPFFFSSTGNFTKTKSRFIKAPELPAGAVRFDD